MSSALLLLVGAVLPAVSFAQGFVQAGNVVRYPVTATTGGSLFGRYGKRQEDVSVTSQLAGTIYTIDLTFGTPGQPVPVQFSTSATELWVNPVCSKASDPALCLAQPRFTLSTTLVDLGTQNSETFRQGYPGNALGTASWEYVYDYVGVGYARISQQIFGVAYDSSLADFGILGAAPPFSGWQNGYPLLIDNLAQQGFINSRAFSMDLQGLESTSGSVIYGGIDVCRFSGSLTKLPIVPAAQSPDGRTRYWINVDSITVDTAEGATVPVSGHPQAFFIDSASTLTALPSDMFANLLAAYPGAVPADYGLYSVGCPEPGLGGSLDFTFGSRVIRVPYSDFIWTDPTSGRCYLGAYDAYRVDGIPTLGDTFLRAAYVVFDWDNQNIHLAQSADCGSIVLPIGTGPDAVPSIVGGCPEPTTTSSSTTTSSTSTEFSTTTTQELTSTTEPPSTTETSTSTSGDFTSDTTTSDVATSETLASETSTSTSEALPTEPSTTETSTEVPITDTSATETSTAEPTSTIEPTDTETLSTTESSSEEPTSAPTAESTTSSASVTQATSEPSSTEDVTPTSAINTESSTASSSSSASSVPTAPPADVPFVFAVSAIGEDSNAVRRHAKRQLQANGGFVGGAGPINPTDCSLATTFNIINGQLSSGGELLSTDADIAYQPFWSSPTVGAITTTFALQDGVLVWQNEAFVGLNAGFCQDATGQVWVTFDGNPPPFDCAAVQLVPYSASECANGSPPTSTAPSAAPTGVSTPLSTSATPASILPATTVVRSTITAVATTTYTVTSCAAGETACSSLGQVTTELLTSLAAVCPQTTATYTLYRTCLCSVAEDGCSVGATVTTAVPLTVRPATAGTPVSVPNCAPTGGAAGGQVGTGGSAAVGVAVATAAAGATATAQMAAVWTGTAAPSAQWTTRAGGNLTAVTAATAAPTVVVVAGAGSVVPALAVLIGAVLVAVGL